MRLFLLAGSLAMAPSAMGAGDDAGFKPDAELSRELARSAVLDLGLRGSPTPADYQLAADLLSIASDLDPGNADLARSVVEAAWSAGDVEAMIESTRRIVKDDPRDTVAQLRLVSAMVNKQQTVEGRLRLYDRFLGEGGASIDPSVKSRLALDAALLERDQGNAQGFIERLHRATRLDVSNKAAASLAAQYYSGITDDPVKLLEYQFKLLFADPLDANVHMAITRLLAREGAYPTARRYLNNAISLFKVDTGRMPPVIEETRIAMNWQIDGPKAVLDELNPILNGRRAEAKARIESYIKAQLPTDELMKPEDIRYGMGIDKLRLLAAYNLEDTEMTQDILDDIESTVNAELRSVAEVMNNRGADRASMLTFIVGKMADFQVLRAIVGLEPDQIRSDIDKIIKQVPGIGPYFAGFEPMALYAEGDYEAAMRSASKFSSSPVLDLIRALTSEKLGRMDDAVELYVSLIRSNGLDAYGAFAHSRLTRLKAEDKVLSDAGREMTEISKTIPNWIDQMNTRPASYMFLSMSATENLIQNDETPTLRIRLKNLAPIPLAVGPSQPIDSRLLILPLSDMSIKGFRGKMGPKVLELNQRLRLAPLEEMVVEIPADSAQTQWLLRFQPNNSIRLRWRLLQGFRPRISDDVLAGSNAPPGASIYGIINSPLGLTAETKLVQRLLLEETKFTPQMLVDQFMSEDRAARQRAVIAAAGRLLVPAPGTEMLPDQKTLLVNGLVELYTRAKNPERAWMILELPQRHQVPEMIAFDDHVVGSIISDALIDSRVDGPVMVGALLTRTDAVDSPMFELLDQVSDDRIREIAAIIRARLETDTPTLGTIGPGVESMVPDKGSLGL